MTTYIIFAHDDEPPQAVKVGWSWPGFFFTWIWALVKGLRPLGIGIFLVFAIAGGFATDSGEAGISIVPLAAGIWLGLSGNKQREADLRGKGYKHVAEVTAANPKKAVNVFLEEEPALALRPPADAVERT